MRYMLRFVFDVLLAPLIVAGLIAWAAFDGSRSGSADRDNLKWLSGFALFVWLVYQQATIFSLRERLSEAEKRLEKTLSDQEKPEATGQGHS